jgi:hypothetical protein
MEAVLVLWLIIVLFAAFTYRDEKYKDEDEDI